MVTRVFVSGLRPKVIGLHRLGVTMKDTTETQKLIARDGVILARARTPIRTGRLLQSTRGQAFSNRATVIQGYARYVAYASFVNYGTQHSRPTHHMQKTDPPWLQAASYRLTSLIQTASRNSGL